jgi:hypothetical protein
MILLWCFAFSSSFLISPFRPVFIVPGSPPVIAANGIGNPGGMEQEMEQGLAGGAEQ